MALLIKHDSLRAALGSGTALAEGKINYNSEQESADGAPPVVETAAPANCFISNRDTEPSDSKGKAHFQQADVCVSRRCLLQNVAFWGVW